MRGWSTVDHCLNRFRRVRVHEPTPWFAGLALSFPIRGALGCHRCGHASVIALALWGAGGIFAVVIFLRLEEIVLVHLNRRVVLDLVDA
jgi:hypothetical protein